jgi:predicted DNA-binding transcriptional regulator AlpA
MRAINNHLNIPLVVTTPWLRAQGLGARNTIWRRVAAKRFPAPDAKIGNRIAWKRETIQEHLEKSGLA